MTRIRCAIKLMQIFPHEEKRNKEKTHGLLFTDLDLRGGRTGSLK